MQKKKPSINVTDFTKNYDNAAFQNLTLVR